MSKLKVRYLETRTLATGETSYVYNPPRNARKAGIVPFESLGLDKATAIARAEELNEQLDQWRRAQAGEPVHRPVKPGTIADLVSLYKASHFFKDLGEETQKSYTQHLNHFIEHTLHGGRRVGDLTAVALEPMKVDEIYGELRSQRGLSAANHIMAVMRVVFNIALRWRKVKWNPFQQMGIENTDSRETVWDRDQVLTFVAKATELGLPSVGLTALLCYELGQRPIDIRRMKWAQYNGDKVYVKQTKTGKRLWLPITPELKVLLDAAPRVSQFVVVSEETHQPYSRNYMAACVRRVKEAAGLPGDLWMSDLRRTAATELGDASATEDEIMSITGHESREIVSIYSRATAKKAENAMAKRLKARESA